MANIEINKEAFDQYIQKIQQSFQDLQDYFANLNTDEQAAFGAIGVGFLLFLIGIILL